MSSLCAVCGAVVRPEFKAPAAELSPDLDFRPGEPARSTLRRWVAECSGCGAAAPNLSTLTEADAEVVRSDPEYAALRAQAPVFARNFLLWALLSQRRDDIWPAAEALLQAAWAADDAEEADWAQLWRAQAAELWPGSREVQPRLCLIDVTRRAGDFALRLLGDRRIDERHGQDARHARRHQSYPPPRPRSPFISLRHDTSSHKEADHGGVFCE